MLEPNAAQAIAAILHELATNAAKYGAFSVRDGRVQLEWSRMADGRIALRWTESKGPPVNLPTHHGFGMRVMETMVVAQAGKIQFSWHSHGLSCEITMPG
jgi:two-component sensor histidine kinase